MPRRRQNHVDFHLFDKVRARRAGEAGVVVGFTAEYLRKPMDIGDNCNSITDIMTIIANKYEQPHGIRILLRVKIAKRGEFLRYPADMDLIARDSKNKA